MNHTEWSKTQHNIIDQRELILPPTWMQRESTSLPTRELGKVVHLTGRERKIVERILKLISGAEEMVVFSSFLLADEEIESALLLAAQRGIRVYAMIASEARLGRPETNDDFDKLVVDQHKRLLKRLGGHILFRSASFFHAKVIVTDPKINPRGLLLTANLTKEALSRNEELAVELLPQQAKEVAEMLGWAMWELAEHELLDPNGSFRSVKPLEVRKHPHIILPSTTPQGTFLKKRALELIDSAQHRLIVSSFGWDKDHQVVQRIAQRAKEGVEVVVLARVRPAAMEALLFLAESGATVYGFNWLHAKAIWVDADVGLIMSANLQADGMDRGFEVGVVLEGESARELEERLATWIDQAPWRLLSKPKLGSVSGNCRVWLQNTLQEYKVTDTKTISVGSFDAESAEHMVVATPRLPPAGALPHPAHKIVATWTVNPPMLPKNAKEVMKKSNGKSVPEPYTPPLFEQNGRKLIAISHLDELELAKKLRTETKANAIVLRGRQ